jgi:protein ImuB
LGADAVFGITTDPDPRPERATHRRRLIESKGRSREVIITSLSLRPLWLLEVPRALGKKEPPHYCREALQRLAGPERIEAGWWDDAEVQRDYFVASTVGGSRYWIYRTAEGWFLHGIFA